MRAVDVQLDLAPAPGVELTTDAGECHQQDQVVQPVRGAVHYSATV